MYCDHSMPYYPTYPVQGAQFTKPGKCPQLPGTVLKVSIPAGAVVNLANLFEVSSPSGICLVVRIPLLGGTSRCTDFINSITQVGGSVEVVNE